MRSEQDRGVAEDVRSEFVGRPKGNVRVLAQQRIDNTTLCGAQLARLLKNELHREKLRGEFADHVKTMLLTRVDQ